MENFSFYLNIGSVDYGNAYDSNCSAHRCSVTSVICHLQYKCVCVCVCAPASVCTSDVSFTGFAKYLH